MPYYHVTYLFVKKFIVLVGFILNYLGFWGGFGMALASKSNYFGKVSYYRYAELVNFLGNATIFKAKLRAWVVWSYIWTFKNYSVVHV